MACRLANKTDNKIKLRKPRSLYLWHMAVKYTTRTYSSPTHIILGMVCLPKWPRQVLRIITSCELQGTVRLWHVGRIVTSNGVQRISAMQHVLRILRSCGVQGIVWLRHVRRILRSYSVQHISGLWHVWGILMSMRRTGYCVTATHMTCYKVLWRTRYCMTATRIAYLRFQWLTWYFTAPTRIVYCKFVWRTAVYMVRQLRRILGFYGVRRILGFYGVQFISWVWPACRILLSSGVELNYYCVIRMVYLKIVWRTRYFLAVKRMAYLKGLRRTAYLSDASRKSNRFGGTA